MLFKAILKLFDSVLHAYGLVALLIVLVILPLFGVHVSQFIELVGGNYTNVISALAASIAASTSLKTRAEHHNLREDIQYVQRRILDLHRAVKPSDSVPNPKPPVS